MNSRVSIVLCTYNGEKFLRSQLDSILSQTYPVYELIIQDDCSTDGTPDIIREYAEKNSVIKAYFNSQNLGFKKNFGDAVSKASGDYIALSDQDDIWLPEHIETLVNIIGNKPMACADSMFIDSEGNSLGYTLSQETQLLCHFEEGIDYAYRIFYNSGPLPGHNSLLTADFAKRCLPIPDKVVFHDFWFSTLACFLGGISYSSKIICLYRQHQNSVTRHKKYHLFKELNMRHHLDFVSNRTDLYEELVKRNDIPPEGLKFLGEFREYAVRCPYLRYRFWCWKWRFSHYRKIYTTNSLKYFLPRSIQYLLLPSFTKKEDIQHLLKSN